VLTNGNVYTVNAAQPWAEGMAVRRGEIVYVGDNIASTVVLQTVGDGRTVCDHAKKVSGLDVVRIEVTNANLQNTIGVEHLNLLVRDEQVGFPICAPDEDHRLEPGPGSDFAPDQLAKAFAALASKGYARARAARAIYWKNTGDTYWIQWTLEDDAAVLWANDPDAGKAVEVLQVREE